MRFSEENFKEFHIFSGDVNQLFGDALYRDECANKFQDALKDWQDICDNISREWYFADPQMTVPTDVDLDESHQILERCTTEEFWNEP